MENRVPQVLLKRAEAGYVWDANSTKRTSNPNTRRPRKDGYDDEQNCVESAALMFGPGMRRKPAPPEGPLGTSPLQPLSWMGC